MRDSDEEIGNKNGGSIAGIYISKGRSDAMNLIEEAERAFLNSIASDGLPRLVVTGPNLPLREPEWSNFLSRIGPIVYWLKVEPSTVYNRLKQRHDKYRKRFDGEPNNGSWNEGILCDLEGERWVDISRDEALKRIPELMKEQLQRYSTAAPNNRAYDSKELTGEALERFAEQIITNMK